MLETRSSLNIYMVGGPVPHSAVVGRSAGLGRKGKSIAPAQEWGGAVQLDVAEYRLCGGDSKVCGRSTMPNKGS